jgi:hypothetical protein
MAHTSSILSIKRSEYDYIRKSSYHVSQATFIKWTRTKRRIFTIIIVIGFFFLCSVSLWKSQIKLLNQLISKFYHIQTVYIKLGLLHIFYSCWETDGCSPINISMLIWHVSIVTHYIPIKCTIVNERAPQSLTFSGMCIFNKTPRWFLAIGLFESILRQDYI